MGCKGKWESGRYASSHGWQILRNFRSITLGRVVLAYISQAGVCESIRNLDDLTQK